MPPDGLLNGLNAVVSTGQDLLPYGTLMGQTPMLSHCSTYDVLELMVKRNL